MFSTTYGLNYNPDDFSGKSGDAASGVSMYSLSLGSPYADQFRRDRAPTQLELLSHLVGTAYRCATLNSDRVAATRLRLYLKTEQGQPKAKFVQWGELTGRRTVKRVPRARVRRWSMAGIQTRSALLDAVRDAGDGEIEEVTDHPALKLLESPEDALIDGGLSPFDFRWVTQMQLEALGRAYWYIKEWKNVPGAGKVPARLALLRAQLVLEKVDQSGKAYIDHFQYGTNHLDPKDVIRFAYPDPANPHLGFLSPMRAAIEKVRLARGGDAFVSALLQNGGFPLGIISPKDENGVIGDKAAARLQSAMRAAAGMDNVGKILVIGSSAVELKSLAWKPAEVIDVERAREIEGQIAACFGVPRTKLYLDDSNKNSGETGEAAHAKDAVLPRCIRAEGTINAQLIPLFDDSGRLFVAYDSPVPDDRTLQLDETRTGGQLGLTNINEGRAALGLDALDDDIGDARILPKGSVLLKPDGSVVDTGGDEPDDDEPAPEPAAKPKKPKKGAALRLLTRELARNDRRWQKRVESLMQRASNDAPNPVPQPVPNVPEVQGRESEKGEVLPEMRDGHGRTQVHGAWRTEMKSRLLAEGYTEAEIDAMQSASVSTATL